MENAVVIAWTGLGLTLLVQGGAYAFFMGKLSNKVDNNHESVEEIRANLNRHANQDMPQAHGCPFYQPKHSEPS